MVGGGILAPGITSKHWIQHLTLCSKCKMKQHEDNKPNGNSFFSSGKWIGREFEPWLVCLFSALRHLLFPLTWYVPFFSFLLFSPHTHLHLFFLRSPCALLSLPTRGTTCEYFYLLSPSLFLITSLHGINYEDVWPLLNISSDVWYHRSFASNMTNGSDIWLWMSTVVSTADEALVRTAVIMPVF